jgi:hypothetical protein
VFRRFQAINWGATCGPGMALAWAYQHFFWSFSKSLYMRALLKVFTSLTSFYLKYFDRYLIHKPGTLDAASGFFFLGRKSDEVLPDRELVKLYRGMCFCRGYDKDSPKYAL